MTSEVYGGPESSTQCSLGKHMQANEENIFSTVTTHKQHLEKLLTHWKHNEACCSDSSFSLNQRHVEGERLRGRCSVLTTGSRRDYLNTDRVCTVTSQHQEWERSQLGEGWIRFTRWGRVWVILREDREEVWVSVLEDVSVTLKSSWWHETDGSSTTVRWKLLLPSERMISDTKYWISSTLTHLFTRDAQRFILHMKLRVWFVPLASQLLRAHTDTRGRSCSSLTVMWRTGWQQEENLLLRVHDLRAELLRPALKTSQ